MRRNPLKGLAHTLVGGPYRTPSVKVGKTLGCLQNGDRPISGLTDAPISWPYSRSPAGHKSLFLTGDLSRAVAVESVLAVCHHWGVSRATVTRWRKTLGVGSETPGSIELRRRLWPSRLGVEGSRKGGLATKGVPKAKGVG